MNRKYKSKICQFSGGLMKIKHLNMALFFLLLSILVVGGTAYGQTKLLRFPDICGNEVVFCYGGDLWKASVSGGLAVRLTAHPGQELFPRFSPDGKWIAFTGQYDGDEQVYVMPSSGGIPKQLTYYPAQGPLPPRWGYDNQVYGWTPDGKKVLFRSLRDANGCSVETALYIVPVIGGLPHKLPMPSSGAGDFSLDGKHMVYSPLFRDFRTWKRYQGGWAQDLYLFNLETYEAKKIAVSKRSERDPMWIGSNIYFSSDRDGTLNLFGFNPADSTVTQLTQNKKWDVRWPASDNRNRIIYELNGELNVYDVETKSNRKISITVPSDGIAMRPSRYPAHKNIEDFELSPKGERALFVARGDIFTLPIKDGPTRNLTNSSNAHDKWARWSPDGARIAFVSDMSGEDQVYLINQDGNGRPEQLTNRFKAMLYAPLWSSDGKRLAFSDKDGKLYVLTVATRQVVEIADDRYGGIFDYIWSPCGGHIAFSMGNQNGYRSLYIWSVADGEVHRITGEYFNEYNPAWDPGGHYLYYLADREFAPQISTWEWNFAGNRETGIFALALRKNVKHLFPSLSDEVTLGSLKSGSKKGKKKPGDKKPAGQSHLIIDHAGLSSRVCRIPVESDNIAGLAVTDGHILYLTRGAFFYGRRSYKKSRMQIFSLKDRKASLLADDVSGYAFSLDGRKVLLRQGRSYSVMTVKPKSKDKKPISVKNMMVDRIPAQEWAAIFWEVWRRYRDFFYVKNMHGNDWKAIGEQYSGWLKHVAHRSDLNYVLGEMVSELSAGHCYIQGGDFEIPERPRIGLPGARFSLDEKNGRYRIAEIFEGDNQETKYRAPLTEVGINLSVNDYILAINGHELKANDNPYRLLRYKTDPVTLTVNRSPSLTGARKVTYKPVFSESKLLYHAWVSANRKKVDRMTKGRVGYLHLPDMGANGIYEFIKWYYPQIRKEGLVVDVRSNGGGNVSQMIIERLDTRMLGTRFGNAGDEPITYPYSVFHGHLVCLINETSASDGDIFPHYFRESNLGPLIGKRTWGGVVGISGRGPLIDGGTVYVPLRGTNNVKGEWIIEGHGVDPDIEVENDPQSVLSGKDPQLERGILEVMKKIQENPKKLPKRPADPVKKK
jgi:tricorn protease